MTRKFYVEINGFVEASSVEEAEGIVERAIKDDLPDKILKLEQSRPMPR